MAEIILAHRETGERLGLNRDHIIYAEENSDGTATILLSNGDRIITKENPQQLRAMPIR